MTVSGTVLALVGVARALPSPQVAPAGSAVPGRPGQRDFPGVRRVELAGNPLPVDPHFEYVRTFIEGALIAVAGRSAR